MRFTTIIGIISSQWPSPLNNQHQTSLTAPLNQLNNRSMTKVLEISSMYFLLSVSPIWLFSILSMFSSANERNTFMLIRIKLIN